MFYNVFMAPPPASNPLLCPGKCNEPRFNTRWPPAGRTSQMLLLLIWLLHFASWNRNKCKSKILQMSNDTKPVKRPLYIWPWIRNNGIFGNDGLQLSGKIKLSQVWVQPKQTSSPSTGSNSRSSNAGVFWAVYFLTKYSDVFVFGVIRHYCSWNGCLLIWTISEWDILLPFKVWKACSAGCEHYLPGPKPYLCANETIWCAAYSSVQSGVLEQCAICVQMKQSGVCEQKFTIWWSADTSLTSTSALNLLLHCQRL